MGFVPEQKHWTALTLEEHAAGKQNHRNITHCTHKSDTLIKSPTLCKHQGSKYEMTVMKKKKEKRDKDTRDDHRERT